MWEQRDGLGAVRLLFLVVNSPIKRGVDHHNPHTALWTHDCFNLETAEQFKSHEWSDESWENHGFMTRIS